MTHRLQDSFNYTPFLEILFHKTEMNGTIDVCEEDERRFSKPGINIDIGPDSRSELEVGKVEDITSSSQLDQAEIFLRENGYNWATADALLRDGQTVKKLIRKVDMVILPLLCGTYCLQYIDKQALSYGAVFDLFKAANVTSDQYSWLGSLFYFGYLFWEYPAAYIAQRFKTGRFISLTVIAWGSVLMFTALTSNFAGLAICRFILGCLEAPITPCFMLIVGSWYDRQQQPFRASCFYCCNGLGSILGSLFSYGIGHLSTGLAIYKAIFLICGGLTVAWGLLLLWLLPNDVMSAKRFSLQEKVTILAIGRKNQTGIYNRTIKLYQIKEAFMDSQVWICFIFTLLNELINGGVANFGKLIIKGLVTDPLKTTLLGLPQGAFQVFFVFSGGFIASRFKNARCYTMMLYLLPTMCGSSLLWKLPRSNTIGLLFGYYIVGAYVASLVISLQMPVCNLSGYTKRVTGTAFVFLGYCIGNIIGPHAFLADEAPVYKTGCKMILSCAICQFALALFLRILLMRRNQKRDKQASEGGVDLEVENETMLDMTDFEDMRFGYQL
ncbi:hypothetical protein HYALB_00012763 [Hymenoscyphus albidus]|uniref:Uncharacterized protein n=1 Tax=Hymenoscyphus albidus TaxID=595503 RepID=A0A9N9LW62_9HELO|nr:hypothetical protein HYALB_00012763 [Hymenoscyphus albidus]